MSARIREAACVVAGYLLLTLVVFRPTLSELGHAVPAMRGSSADALLYVWAIAHVARTLFTDPVHLFDGPMFWPSPRTLAHSDHMIGQTLLGLPVWWATGNPLLVFNLLCLLSYPFLAAATYAWARTLGAGPAGAAAAGLVAAFTPLRLAIGQWIQLLVMGFLPLALRAWLRFVADLRLRDWALWVLWWTAHGLMGMYLGFYGCVLFGVLGLEAVLLAPVARRGRLLAGTLAAPVATGLLLAPTLWPYAALRIQQGHVRAEGLDTPWSFLLPSAGTWTGALAGVTDPLAFGPGLVVVALALVGLLAPPRREGPLPAWFRRTVVLTGLVACLLMLLLPVRWLLHVPGFDMLRLTNRAILVALVFVAPLVADGVDRLCAAVRRPALHAALAAVLVGAIALDMGTPGREHVRMPFGDELPFVDRWLREHVPPGTPVYELANGMDAPARAMFFSIFNGVKLVNGYSGFTSPGHAYLTQRLFRFPSAESLATLQELGIRWVVARFPNLLDARIMAEKLPTPWVTVAGSFGLDVVYEVHGVPPATPPAPHPATLPRTGWSLSATGATDLLPLLVDGDPATAWRLDVPHQQGVPWVTVDLGRVEPVAGVRVLPVRVDPPAVYYMDVQLSEDGQDWFLTNARFRPASLAEYLAHPALGPWTARFPTRPARYVRLINPEHAYWGGWWEMAELDVLVDAPPAP